ncbi:MAG TPA: hypothetical protein VMC85_20900, partial [Desulfomonilaceae bacterium]|nr:hypothetical protein [Desulfomonilaceae bacterium]
MSTECIHGLNRVLFCFIGIIGSTFSYLLGVRVLQGRCKYRNPRIEVIMGWVMIFAVMLVGQLSAFLVF